MQFKPVHRESTREKVHAAIREAILDGQLRLGQRLTEISLAKQFGVSRAVIREALQQLAHDGLVEQNAYRGSQVVSLSLEQAEEILGTRLILEAEAIRLAIRSMTPASHRYLEDLAERMHDSDPTLASELDLAFHEKIWDLSGNTTLRKILLQITAPLFAMGSIMRHGRRGAEAEKRAAFQRSSHAAIIRYLEAGDTERAIDAMRTHISENWTQIRKHMKDYLAGEHSTN